MDFDRVGYAKGGRDDQRRELHPTGSSSRRVDRTTQADPRSTRPRTAGRAGGAVGDVSTAEGVDNRVPRPSRSCPSRELSRPSAARLLGDIARPVRERGWAGCSSPGQGGPWVADTVVDVAPHIPVRDLDTLRRHYPGLDGDALADRLVRNAARTSAGIGAVGGGVAAVEWAAPPTLLTTPVLLAAETVAVVAVEIKLIGELQELYGQPVPGGRPAGGQAAAGVGRPARRQPARCPAAASPRCSVRPPARNCGTAWSPVRPQPDHAGPDAHRGGGRRLPQPAGHKGLGRSTHPRSAAAQRPALPSGPALPPAISRPALPPGFRPRTLALTPAASRRASARRTG